MAAFTLALDLSSRRPASALPVSSLTARRMIHSVRTRANSATIQLGQSGAPESRCTIPAIIETPVGARGVSTWTAPQWTAGIEDNAGFLAPRGGSVGRCLVRWPEAAFFW